MLHCVLLKYICRFAQRREAKTAVLGLQPSCSHHGSEAPAALAFHISLYFGVINSIPLNLSRTSFWWSLLQTTGLLHNNGHCEKALSFNFR